MIKQRVFGLGRMKAGTMNKTEKAYSEVLEMRKMAGEILWWKFEGITFKLAHDTRYTPDFSAMMASGEIQIFEVKGNLNYIQDDAKVKIKVAAESFPFRFFLVAPIARKNGGGWTVKCVGGQE